MCLGVIVHESVRQTRGCPVCNWCYCVDLQGCQMPTLLFLSFLYFYFYFYFFFAFDMSWVDTELVLCLMQLPSRD